MKQLVSILSLLVCISFNIDLSAQNYNYGEAKATNLSSALSQIQVSHITYNWHLDELRDNNKLELILEAIHYNAFGKTDAIKGIKVTIIDADGSASEGSTKKASEYHTYIDEEEYTDVLVVLNQMISDAKRREVININGSMSYISKGGLYLGYTINKQKQVAQLGIVFNQAPLLLEYSSIEKTLLAFREQIEIASKELYLPENEDKLNKSKKNRQEAEDVIVDDI